MLPPPIGLLFGRAKKGPARGLSGGNPKSRNLKNHRQNPSFSTISNCGFVETPAKFRKNRPKLSRIVFLEILRIPFRLATCPHCRRRHPASRATLSRGESSQNALTVYERTFACFLLLSFFRMRNAYAKTVQNQQSAKAAPETYKTIFSDRPISWKGFQGANVVALLFVPVFSLRFAILFEPRFSCQSVLKFWKRT